MLKLAQGPEKHFVVARMKAAKFGVFFFGMGLSMTRGKHMNSAALLTLAAEMNAFIKRARLHCEQTTDGIGNYHTLFECTATKAAG